MTDRRYLAQIFHQVALAALWPSEFGRVGLIVLDGYDGSPEVGREAAGSTGRLGVLSGQACGSSSVGLGERAQRGEGLQEERGPWCVRG